MALMYRHDRIALPLAVLAELAAGDIGHSNLRHELVLEASQAGIIARIFNGLSKAFTVHVQIWRQAVLNFIIGSRVLTDEKPFYREIWLICSNCLIFLVAQRLIFFWHLARVTLQFVVVHVVLTIGRVVLEDFLRMGAHLGANPCRNMLSDFLPIFAI